MRRTLPVLVMLLLAAVPAGAAHTFTAVDAGADPLAWSPALAEVAAWRTDHVARCLEELASDDFFVRQAADDRLRALSGRDVGFDAKAPETERTAAIERWRAWARGDGGSR